MSGLLGFQVAIIASKTRLRLINLHSSFASSKLLVIIFNFPRTEQK
jgi:hypothetical protein